MVHFKQHERGQSFVELALILPVLFVIMAGVLDLGRFFLTYMELRDAAQEGVNYASLTGNYSTASADAVDYKNKITARVQDAVKFPFNLDVVLVDVTPTSLLCTDSTVNVAVTYDFKVSAPFIGILFANQQITMSAQMTGKVLLPACPGSLAEGS